MIKKTKLILISVLFLFSSTTFSVAAQTTSPSPAIVSPTATPSGIPDEIKEKVKQRIEEIKQQVLKRAFWGTLKERVDSTLVIKAADGEKRIKTNTNTVFVGTGKKEVKIADLEIDNFILALGDWQENGTLMAKRVLVMAKAPKPAPQRYAFFGKVSQISKDKKMITVSALKSENTEQIQIASTTIINKIVEGKPKQVVFAAIQTGDLVVVIGTKKTESSPLTAKIIKIVSSSASSVIPTATPTPVQKKPTPTPTKSVKPSPTPTKT